MKIINLARDLEITSPAKGIRLFADGTNKAVPMTIAAEHFVDVYINDILTMRLVCTANDLAELVLGRMYTEGMIHSVEEVDYIYVCRYGKRVRVALKKQAAACRPDFVETTGSCCTNNHLLTDVFRDDTPPQPVTPIPWEPGWIYSLAKRFEESTPLFIATHSVHSCYLAIRDQLLYCCEDLGRHNAVDKAIGCALRDGVDLTQCILFSSGRLPTDMVSKAIRAGVPILASKTVATERGIELARQFRLTLIVFAREDKFTVIPPDAQAEDGAQSALSVSEQEVPRLTEAEFRQFSHGELLHVPLTGPESRAPEALLSLPRDKIICLSAKIESDGLSAARVLISAGYSVFLLQNTKLEGTT